MTSEVAALLTLALAHGSPAEPTRAVAAPMAFEGTAGSSWEAGLRAALIRGLVEGELSIVASDGAASGCQEGSCATVVTSEADARYLVTTQVNYSDRTYGFTIDAYDGATGELVASSSDRCSLCGSKEAQELLSKQAAGIGAKLTRLASEPAEVQIITEPPGAQVRVDGELRGETPLTLDLTDGTHRIELSMEGRTPIARSVDAVRGVAETLHETLLPAPVGTNVDTPARSGRGLRVGGAVAVGGGVAALATGVAFIVLDGAPRRSRCTGPDVDEFGNCRQVFTSLPHGVAFAVTGAALVGAGVGLVIAGVRKQARPSRRTQARIWVSGGMVRGWF